MNYNRMSKIHVWIGNSKKSSEDFYDYFKINHEDKDLGIGASQFDKDIGINWYDDDLIGIFHDEDCEDLEIVIDEIPTSPDSLKKIHDKCIVLGIETANSMFYYEDSDLVINDISKKYNDIDYIGCFDN